MAVVTTLVHQAPNHLRYLLVSSGSFSQVITSTGAATPDLLTDSVAGPLRNLALAFTNGYGPVAAGAFTQAQARSLWLSNGQIGNLLNPSARCALTARVTDRNLGVDANVDGSGHPTITVSGGTGIAPWTAYLDIEIGEAIGD